MSTNYQLENIENRIKQENQRHQRAKQGLERQKQRESEQHASTIKRLKDEKDRITKTHRPQTDEEYEPNLCKKLIKEIEQLLEEVEED